jgi:hypothetical protein
MLVMSWLNVALSVYAQIATTILGAAFERSLRKCCCPQGCGEF